MNKGQQKSTQVQQNAHMCAKKGYKGPEMPGETRTVTIMTMRAKPKK